MKVHSGFDQWQSEGRTAVSLGNFDGVHVGHRLILQKTIDLARSLNLPAVAITFDPVPKKILNPQNAPRLIQTLEQRLSMLEALGMDDTVVVKFSEEFARKTPEEFVRQFLIDRLQVRFFVVGENFSFGHQKRGDLSLLKQLGTQNDFEVEGVREVHRNGIRISSSQIREFILKGAMKEAHDFLGYPFALTGKIIEGEHVGGKLGIPTANLKYENEILPARGVYVTRAVIKNEEYAAATNIGYRPTFEGQNLTVESHLVDFAGDLYGVRMELRFFEKLRDEMRFTGPMELKAQIQQDIKKTTDYWANQ